MTYNEVILVQNTNIKKVPQSTSVLVNDSNLVSEIAWYFKIFTNSIANKTDCLKKVRCDVSKADEVYRKLTLVLHSNSEWIEVNNQFDFHIQNKQEGEK